MKLTRELLEPLIASSMTFSDVVRKLGRTPGGNNATIKKAAERLEISTDHFLGQRCNRGRVSNKRKSLEDILVVRPVGSNREHGHLLRRALIEIGVPYLCSCCGCNAVWNGKPLVLDVDHIDGNVLDCGRENLRFLCPNCHSQTPTYGSRNGRLGQLSRPTRLESGHSC